MEYNCYQHKTQIRISQETIWQDAVRGNEMVWHKSFSFAK